MQAGANKLLLVMGSEAGGGQGPGAGDLKHGERVTTEGYTSSYSVDCQKRTKQSLLAFIDKNCQLYIRVGFEIPLKSLLRRKRF